MIPGGDVYRFKRAPGRCALGYVQPICFQNFCTKNKKKTKAFASSPQPPPLTPSKKTEVSLFGAGLSYFLNASFFNNAPKDMSIRARAPTFLFSLAQTSFHSTISHHQFPKPKALHLSSFFFLGEKYNNPSPSFLLL